MLTLIMLTDVGFTVVGAQVGKGFMPQAAGMLAQPRSMRSKEREEERKGMDCEVGFTRCGFTCTAVWTVSKKEGLRFHSGRNMISRAKIGLTQLT